MRKIVLNEEEEWTVWRKEIGRNEGIKCGNLISNWGREMGSVSVRKGIFGAREMENSVFSEGEKWGILVFTEEEKRVFFCAH